MCLEPPKVDLPVVLLLLVPVPLVPAGRPLFLPPRGGSAIFNLKYSAYWMTCLREYDDGCVWQEFPHEV